MSSRDLTVFNPATWYAITARDNNQECENSGQTFDVPLFYSNAGTNCFVTCGKCGKRMEILTASALDPQPEMS